MTFVRIWTLWSCWNTNTALVYGNGQPAGQHGYLTAQRRCFLDLRHFIFPVNALHPSVADRIMQTTN
ncbi:MAG TPA: hypothetical protein VKJ65_04390, partial [Phycisphaerae bacterium]|nr:hypothetical protein [Phycisphaerae bacterium]